MTLEVAKVITHVQEIHGDTYSAPEIGSALALMCGAISIGIGLLRIGFILEFIPGWFSLFSRSRNFTDRLCSPSSCRRWIRDRKCFYHRNNSDPRTYRCPEIIQHPRCIIQGDNKHFEALTGCQTRRCFRIHCFVRTVFHPLDTEKTDQEVPATQEEVLLHKCHAKWFCGYRRYSSSLAPYSERPQRQGSNHHPERCSKRFPTCWSPENRHPTCQSHHASYPRSGMQPTSVDSHKDTNHLKKDHHSVAWTYFHWKGFRKDQWLQDQSKPGSYSYRCYKHYWNLLRGLSGNWIVLSYCPQVQVWRSYTSCRNRHWSCCYPGLVCAYRCVLLHTHGRSSCVSIMYHQTWSLKLTFCEV